MKTAVEEQRLIIVSDVHLGNPLVRAGHRFRDFLSFALDHGYSVCINGDGMDMVHMSISRLTHELWECFSVIKRFPGAGLRVYHTVGNHDIVLEHFLQDWAGLRFVPFLNVQSGNKRIRVEHGHMYDRFFLAVPRIYAAVTTIGGWVMRLNPTGYHHLTRSIARVLGWPHRLLAWARHEPAGQNKGILAERPAFGAAAEEISARGFDAVVFGHTHRAGQAVLPGGALYFNTGFWLLRPCCVVVDHGELWFGSIDELMARPLPVRRI